MRDNSSGGTDRLGGRFTIPSPRSARRAARSRTCHCELCELEASGLTPAEAAAAAWERTRSRIERFGIEITAIPLEGNTPPFAYTTGRCVRGLPELLVVGLHPTSAAALLNDLDAIWDHPCPEHQLQAELDCEVELLPIPEAVSRRYLLQSWRFAAERGIEPLDALQAVWADDDGWTPLDPDAPSRVRRIQPILGEATRARR